MRYKQNHQKLISFVGRYEQRNYLFCHFALKQLGIVLKESSKEVFRLDMEVENTNLILHRTH